MDDRRLFFICLMCAVLRWLLRDIYLIEMGLSRVDRIEDCLTAGRLKMRPALLLTPFGPTANSLSLTSVQSVNYLDQIFATGLTYSPTLRVVPSDKHSRASNSWLSVIVFQPKSIVKSMKLHKFSEVAGRVGGKWESVWIAMETYDFGGWLDGFLNVCWSISSFKQSRAYFDGLLGHILHLLLVLLSFTKANEKWKEKWKI